MSNIAESICRKVRYKLRRSALHDFIIHCGTNSVRIASPRTMTESYTQCLPKALPYLMFYDRDTQIQTIYSYITKVNRLNTLVGSLRNLITLLKYTLFCYIVELYPTITHRRAIPNPNTLLRYTLSHYIAKQFPISIQC